MFDSAADVSIAILHQLLTSESNVNKLKKHVCNWQTVISIMTSELW